MTHVLAVPAFKLGDPVPGFILMEPDNPAFHLRTRGANRVSSACP